MGGSDIQTEYTRVLIDNKMNVMVKAFFVAISHNILVVDKTGCISNIAAKNKGPKKLVISSSPALRVKVVLSATLRHISRSLKS